MEQPHILVIDDEEVVLDSCLQILGGRDYRVSTAANGERGLRLVQEAHPDLVFVDLKMPGISGMEVLEQIHAADPTIVTIVITGYATVDSAVDAMKRGAYDFLPKPFTPDEFRLIAQRGVERRRLVLETIALRREREMLKEHFGAIVSHELKSPLGAVQQNLYALTQELSGVLNPHQRERLSRMETSIDSLLKLIRTWLRIYTTDIDRIAEAFQPTSIAEVVSAASEAIQPQAIRKDIEIVSSIEDDLPKVNGDQGTLVEALVNILGNAVKFSRMSSQIHVAANREGGSILIRVADSGVGIADEDLSLVFEGFHSGQPGEGAERGSGLGLAITRRILQAHHGAVSVESKLGTGTTFSIRLPAVPPGAETIDEGGS